MTKIKKSELERLLEKHLKLRKPEFNLETIGSRISGSIISETFKNRSDMDRQRMIWDVIEREYGPEYVGKVGTLLAYTPDEWNLDLQGSGNGF